MACCFLSRHSCFWVRKVHDSYFNDREVGFAAKRSRRAYPWNLVGEDRSAGVLSFYLLYFSITILNMTILRALTRLSATFSPPKIGDETGDFETFTYIYQIISHYQHPPKLGLHSTNHHSRLPQISGTEWSSPIGARPGKLGRGPSHFPSWRIDLMVTSFDDEWQNSINKLFWSSIVLMIFSPCNEPCKAKPLVEGLSEVAADYGCASIGLNHQIWIAAMVWKWKWSANIFWISHMWIWEVDFSQLWICSFTVKKSLQFGFRESIP